MSDRTQAARRRNQEKGAETRERIYSAAIRRFQADGFAGASLRSIAAEVGVTPALLYRYFENKDALVTELYGRLLDQWVERAAAMPEGTWVERTLWLTRLSMEVLAPYRRVLRALLGPMLDAHPTVSPLHNESSRTKAQPLFLRAVSEARDAPRDAAELADAAYLAQLALLFFWVVDRSREQVATRGLLTAFEGISPLLAMGLKMPFVRPRLLALGRHVRAGLIGDEPAEAVT
jgi:AcrR family transcriptional regulator